jgi:hypothetical protein
MALTLSLVKSVNVSSDHWVAVQAITLSMDCTGAWHNTKPATEHVTHLLDRHTQGRIHRHALTRIDTHTHTCNTHTPHMHRHTYARAHTHKHTHWHAHTHVACNTHTPHVIGIDTHIHTRASIHTHTHTHTHTRARIDRHTHVQTHTYSTIPQLFVSLYALISVHNSCILYNSMFYEILSLHM